MTLETAPVTETAIAITGLDHAPGGYLHGLRQPFLQAGLRIASTSSPDWSAVDAAISGAAWFVHEPPPPFSADLTTGALQRIFFWTPLFQRAHADGAYEAGRLLWRAGADGVVIALPTIEPNIAAAALHLVVGGIGQGLGGAPFDLSAAQQRLDEAQARSAVNFEMVQFLQMAHEAGIPWIRPGNVVFQLGYGARSRWLENTMSDATGVLAAQIAGNKASTASILRNAGLPAPAHFIAMNEEQAAAAAERLGYPVVVKPLDASKGQGVHVGLEDAAAVRRAFSESIRHSAKVLVETFVPGSDFRLTVVNGELIGANSREPAHIVGDGVNTVRDLVAAENETRRRDPFVVPRKKPIAFDDEAIAYLAAAGLNGASVPAKGQRIRLRGAANLARGGTPGDVMDQVHPDNALLAVRAARTLRLDIAGVDLITPDLSRSWKEVGGSICEVNAQPEFLGGLPMSAYETLVRKIAHGDGRIPIGVVLGLPAGSRALTLAARCLAAAGSTAGVAEGGGVWIAGEQRATGPIASFAAARMALADQDVQSMLLGVSDPDTARSGLPFDRANVVALAGAGAAEFEALARSILPMGAGPVVANAEDAACARLAAETAGGRAILYAADPARLRDHRAGSGPAVWLEGDGIVFDVGVGAPKTVPLETKNGGAEFSAADVLLAAALAGAMGCDQAILRRGFAGVRLAT